MAKKLYYFDGRNTAVVADSAAAAKANKKRGGDKIVAVKTPSPADKKTMARGDWVRTRRDGKTPEKSALGKGRGFGPPRPGK